jgi:hypothetical protein
MANRQRGHHATKTLVGIVVLLVGGAAAALFGVRAAIDIANPNARTRLERFVSGEAVTRVDLPRAGASFEFPSAPVASTEQVHLPNRTIVAERRISAASADAVELVWFATPAGTAKGAAGLAPFAAGLARDLGGTPAGGTALNDLRPDSYEFSVKIPTTNYVVRVLRDGQRMYVLRVRSKSVDQARNALAVFARSYRPLTSSR